MFCRFCGFRVAPDSVYCSRCGKKIQVAEDPAAGASSPWRWLKTPWPWAAALFAAFLTWALWVDRPGPDLSLLAMNLELLDASETPGEGLFHHRLSLVVENLGAEPVGQIPVGLSVALEPAQDAEVAAEFRNGRFVILSEGVPRPLVLVLTDTLAGSEKRRFPIETFVDTSPPADIIYTVESDPPGQVLATLSVPVSGEGSL